MKKKKIFLFLLGVLLPFLKVLAETNYIWSETKRDDLKLIKEETRYKFYKPLKKGKYILKGKESEYAYEDEKAITYSEYSELKECSSSLDESTEITKVTVYPYIKLNKTRYLKITNASDSSLSLNDIKILSEETIIEYKINNLPVILSNGETIIIDLVKDYSTKSLKLYLGITEDSIYDISLFDNQNEKIVLFSLKGNTSYHDIGNILKNNYSDIKYSEEKIEDEDAILLEEKQMCKERKVYTFRYNLEKEYYDDYHLSLEDSSYIKDTQNSKVYYKYQVENTNFKTNTTSENKEEELPKNKEPKKDKTTNTSEDITSTEKVENIEVTEVQKGQALEKPNIKIVQKKHLILSIAICISSLLVLGYLLYLLITKKMSKKLID